MHVVRFVDETTIRVKGGDGGRGCASLRREKFVPRGGPDGGDGGRGGNVTIVATSRAATLLDLQITRHYRAQRGEHGKGKDMHGAAGKDIEIPVPEGTVIYDADTGSVLGDLIREGDRLIVAEGGKGGRGNARFVSSIRQAPDHAQPGLPGQQATIRLELKLLADVGLVGLPNAGKSTLIRQMSRSRARVAAYPFTTLVPNLGVVAYDDDRSFVIADVPGLVRGAAEGAGLGHQFLRHIERTRVLVYLLDLCSGEQTPGDALQILREELGRYEPALLERPALVCLNKVDLMDSDTIELAREELGAMGITDVLLLSALEGKGVPELRGRLADLVEGREREPW